jgi:hypothetical protein
MRKLLTVSLVAVAVLATAGPTWAAPPTAKQLVNRLVRAGLCLDSTSLNAAGTIYNCTVDPDAAYPTEIEVHAFKTHRAMADDLDAEHSIDCQDILTRDLKFRYRVGPTWWMNPYRGELRAAIAKTLGGNITKLGCI